MALKQLIFGLLAFVCIRGSEKSFMTKIKGTGSEQFFKAFFKEISNDKPHKFAVFEMNAGLVNGTLEIPVASWQVREFNFAFGHEDVKKSVELQGEDQDQDQGQKKSITFDDIVSAIESYFKQYNPKSTKEGPNRFKLNELGAYIALWMKELYRFMEDDSRKRECAHLLATIGRRLLYKMTLKDQKELLKSVLAKPFNGPMFHEYHHELIGWHPMPIRCPAAYEEQKMLVAALIDKGVTPYVISKMPKLYLEAMIEHSKLKIELQHTFGSITEAEIHGKGEDDVMADVLLGKVQAADGEGKMKIIEAKLEGRTADFASGASMSDFEMINHVLKKGGFALLQQDGTLEEELINLVEATNKNDKNIKQAHIQKVNWEGAKWAL
ncbi:hypothetical protein ABG067_007237 [Albugo candida]